MLFNIRFFLQFIYVKINDNSNLKEWYVYDVFLLIHLFVLSQINFEGIQASLIGKRLGSLLTDAENLVSNELQNVITERTKTLQDIGKGASELGTKLGTDLATETEKVNRANCIIQLYFLI